MRAQGRKGDWKVVDSRNTSAGRQKFMRAMRAIDAEYTRDNWGGKLCNAESRRRASPFTDRLGAGNLERLSGGSTFPVDGRRTGK
jgi:hypothetical protein